MDAAIHLCYCLLLTAVCSTFAQERVAPEPPSIRDGPRATAIYYTSNKGDDVELPCVATGQPKPNYQWMKNGQTFSYPMKEEGTIVFTNTDKEHEAYEGIYQCFARNSEGAAMSNTVQLIYSVRASFAERGTMEVPATVGRPLRLDCTVTGQSIPPPRTSMAGGQMDYTWIRNATKQPWLLNKRTQIDDSGRLNIAYVKQEDIDRGFIWLCKINNYEIGVESSGSAKKIVSSGQMAVPPSKPEIMFYTNQTSNPSSGPSVVVALEGQPASLRCFFSGGEDISYGWQRTGGSPLPSDGSVEQIEHNTELRFRSVKKSDEDNYKCIGTNSGYGTTEFEFRFLVHAIPKFINDEDGPRDTNASVGENVVMRCNAYAIPEANVVWYKDGIQFGRDNLPSRKFHMSEDRTTLTIMKVCKDDCGPDGNDRMVLQCNASNEHGYVLRNGFINVYVRTNLTMRPESVERNPGETVSFTAKAVTDPNTPVTYTWKFQADDCPDTWCLVQNETDRISVTRTDNGTTLTIRDIQEKDFGRYKVEASNFASTDFQEFNLGKVIIAAALVWEFWYIPLIIVILLLLLILLIFCICCYLYRNRGDEYPVDEKEREADRDPEKELADSGFHDYQRPTTDDDERRLLTA